MDTIFKTSTKISIIINKSYIEGKVAMTKNNHIHININPSLLPESIKNYLFEMHNIILDINKGDLIIRENLLKRYLNSIKSHKTYKIRGCHE